MSIYGVQVIGLAIPLSVKAFGVKEFGHSFECLYMVLRKLVYSHSFECLCMVWLKWVSIYKSEQSTQRDSTMDNLSNTSVNNTAPHPLNSPGFVVCNVVMLLGVVFPVITVNAVILVAFVYELLMHYQ